MNELSQILRSATAAIAPDYFLLNIQDGAAVYRERVYCYELYHQMRTLWPESTPFLLNGEVDKAAHPILSKLGISTKPDLLVHRPGSMKHNHAVIEVKKAGSHDDDVIKDLRTLSDFINKAEYQRALYLVYGHRANSATARRIKKLATGVMDLACIELWLHQTAQLCAVHHVTLGPQNTEARME